MSRGGTFASNVGLRDQVAALRWVQQHITAFGGDPHNVVLAGSEAGAASVSYLITSPLAAGTRQLFHNHLYVLWA